MLTEFIEYLFEQINMPYIWGCQHTEVTPENYESVIDKHETSAKYREAAKKYCENLWEDGFEIAYAYDCSGLGMYWLQNVQHIYAKDMSANSMKGCCELVSTEPKKGYWVFRCDSSGKATHIGYMISDTELIEAKGRAYGVVKTVFKSDEWSVWGIPACFAEEIDPQPEPPEPPTPPQPKKKVVVIAKSVRVRKGDGILSKTILIAHNKEWYKEHNILHGNDKFNLIDIAESGWYHIETKAGTGYITNKPKYTKLVEA